MIQIEKDVLLKEEENKDNIVEIFEMQMLGVRYLSEMLSMNTNEKIEMVNKVYKEYGLPDNILSTLKDDEALDFDSIMKKGWVSISESKFNTLMIAKGLLELKSRPSSNGKTKEFKSLTKLGLEYGKNLINPHNEKETQPHYYTSKFDELIKLLNI